MGKYSQPVTYGRQQHSNPAQATQRAYAPLDWTKVDVVAVIERYTSTRLSGKGHHTQLVGACPYPDCSVDENGFIVWPDGSKQSTATNMHHFYCRGCRRAGDVIKLLRDLYPAWTFQQTLIAIGMRDEEGNAVQGTPVVRRAASENVWLSEQLTMLQGYYHDLQVALATFERPQLYLQSRGIRLEDAQRYGLGYYPTRAETRRKADDPHVASWGGRIIFPLSSPNSELTFEGRTLLLWQEGMTPEQHKRAIEQHNATCEQSQRIERVLKTSPCGNFGYAEAIKSSHLVICEGPCDALSLLLAGIENVVAMGTSLPAKTIPLNVERVTLALDADKAGNEAAKRLASGLADRGIEVQTVLPIAGKDWNDTHVQDGLPAIAQAFREPEREIEQVVAAHTVQIVESEQDALCCSVCGKDALTVDNFYFSATGVPYCSHSCEQQALSSEQGKMSLEQFASSVSAIASVLGTCKIERIERGTTLAQWLTERGIAFSDDSAYTPVTLPALPRSKCPHKVFVERIEREVGTKQTYQTLKATPCSGIPTGNGWCPEHEDVALMLSLAAQLGYPELYVSESLVVYAGVASWEEFACLAAGSVPIKHNHRTVYTEPYVKRVLPRLQTMLEQRARARA